VKIALVLVLIAAACEGSKQPEPKREPERPARRVIEAPSRGVRALPPHAIRADGVGPYRLGATVTTLLDQLRSGPNITQFTLPGVIQRDIVRAEEGAILIGVEPQGKATFVSVVDAEIARTEAGVHVGSTRAELATALGAPLVEPDRAHDPRIVIPSKLDNARVLFDGDRIAAFVIAAETERGKDGKDGKEPPAERDVVTTKGDELQLTIRGSERPIVARIPGMVWAATVRNPGDGRDEVVAIVKAGDAQSTTWSLVPYRFHEGKLSRVVVEPAVLYQLTAANARWIGAEIRDLDLLLEVTSRADTFEVGGLLTTRAGDKIRDIVVISPVSVGRRRAKAAPQEPMLDAGTSDAAQ
jgi:hypothetical protein